MKRIVCFSGGHSSAISAIEVVRKYGREDVVLLNHDISHHVEHEDIKRFKQEVADYLKLPITYANMQGWEELTPIKIALKNKAFKAKSSPAFCTSRLKTEPFYTWLKTNGVKGDEIIYGFDEDETNRINRRSSIIIAMGYKPVFPLVEYDRTIFHIEEVGIKRPITYQIYKHANCIGCLKAGKQHWYCVYCLRPDIYNEAKQAEREIGYTIIKGVSLADLEPEYKAMKDRLNILPTDIKNASKFWAEVRKAFREYEKDLPCDCSF